MRMPEDEIDQLLVDHVIADEAGGMEHQDAPGIDVPDGDQHRVMPGQMPDDDVVSLQFLAPGDELHEVEDEAVLPNVHIPASETLEDHDDAAIESSEDEEDEDIAVRSLFFVIRCIVVADASIISLCLCAFSGILSIGSGAGPKLLIPLMMEAVAT